jgi:hypothetical protein
MNKSPLPLLLAFFLIVPHRLPLGSIDRQQGAIMAALRRLRQCLWAVGLILLAQMLPNFVLPAGVIPAAMAPLISAAHADEDWAAEDPRFVADFQFCRHASVGRRHPGNASAAHQASDHHDDDDHDNGRLDVWYQCQGPPYERFARDLHQYSAQQVLRGRVPPTWGHRASPLPPHTRVLLFGNSHARQMGHAWACQGGADVRVHSFETHMVDPHMATRIDFLSSNSTLYIVANSYVAYSPHWQRLLAAQIQTPLADLDAIILGVFNQDVGGTSWFAHAMDEMAARQLPAAAGVDRTRHAGPTLDDVAAAVAHDVPILVVSPLGLILEDQVQENGNQLAWWQALGDGRPVEALDARYHIRRLGQEGGSLLKLNVSEVVHNSRRARTYHRCMGALGGHPDLVAWDISERLYKLLG